MVCTPTHRRPTHPGEMLKEEFLDPMGITQSQLAEAIGVPYQRINEIVNGRRGITPSTALRLAKYFQVSPDFWLNLQLRLDLYDAQQKEGEQIEKILPSTTKIKGVAVDEFGDIYLIEDYDHVADIEACFIESKQDAIVGFSPSPVLS